MNSAGMGQFIQGDRKWGKASERDLAKHWKLAIGRDRWNVGWKLVKLMVGGSLTKRFVRSFKTHKHRSNKIYNTKLTITKI